MMCWLGWNMPRDTSGMSLSQRIDLRVFPRLRFHWDPTFEKAEKIERLIASLHQDSTEPGSPTGGQAKVDG